MDKAYAIIVPGHSPGGWKGQTGPSARCGSVLVDAGKIVLLRTLSEKICAKQSDPHARPRNPARVPKNHGLTRRMNLAHWAQPTVQSALAKCQGIESIRIRTSEAERVRSALVMSETRLCTDLRLLAAQRAHSHGPIYATFASRNPPNWHFLPGLRTRRSVRNPAFGGRGGDGDVDMTPSRDESHGQTHHPCRREAIVRSQPRMVRRAPPQSPPTSGRAAARQHGYAACFGRFLATGRTQWPSGRMTENPGCTLDRVSHQSHSQGQQPQDHEHSSAVSSFRARVFRVPLHLAAQGRARPA